MSQSPQDPGQTSREYSIGWGAIYRLMREGKSWSGYERNCCFLNTDGERFADVSSVTGVDFDDDGRGLAVVDWDHDGDLDLWLTNRTSPRVRYLRNDAADGNRFLALRLEGRTCNRDAIGARVEVTLRDAGSRRLVKAVHAGDAYISQSSRWLHFGLGASADIEQVTVRWPGGGEQAFTSLEADRRYVLRQDTPTAEAWERPGTAVVLEPAPVSAPDSEQQVRVRLAAPLPLPGVVAMRADDTRVPIPPVADRPVLVSLWASWCPHCRQELKELARDQTRLKQAGVMVLAVSVDKPADRGKAQAILREIEWPFDAAYAGAELLDLVEVLQEVVLDRPRSIVLPTSLLFGTGGQVTVLYRGPLSVDTVVSDAATRPGNLAAFRDAAVPWPGRWARPPDPPAVVTLADRLRVHGQLDVAAQLLAGVGLRSDSPAPDWAKERLANVNVALGRDLAEAGRHEPAVAAYQRALNVRPRNALAHRRMTQSLREMGRWQDAVRAAEAALQLAPNDPQTIYDLGLAYLAGGDRQSAHRQYGRLTELRSPLAAELLRRIQGGS